jgi:hypothetical protein
MPTRTSRAGQHFAIVASVMEVRSVRGIVGGRVECRMGGVYHRRRRPDLRLPTRVPERRHGQTSSALVRHHPVLHALEPPIAHYLATTKTWSDVHRYTPEYHPGIRTVSPQYQPSFIRV